MAWKDTDPEKIKEYNRKYYQEKRKLKRQEQAKLKVRRVECPICKSKFTPEHPNQIYCCDACKTVARKIKMKLYRQTETYQEKMKEYRQSDAYKVSRKKYRQSEKGKLSVKRYQQSEKGKQAIARSIEKAKQKKETTQDVRQD